MKVNDIPMVPLAALERAQGELKSAYCQIADLHADIEESCQEIDRLRLDNGLLEQANCELEVEKKQLQTLWQTSEERANQMKKERDELQRLSALDFSAHISGKKKGAKKA